MVSGHMSKALRQVQENLKFVDLWRFLWMLSCLYLGQDPVNKIVGDKPKAFDFLIRQILTLGPKVAPVLWKSQTLSCQLTEASNCKVVTDAQQKLQWLRLHIEERGIKDQWNLQFWLSEFNASQVMNRLAGKRLRLIEAINQKCY